MLQGQRLNYGVTAEHYSILVGKEPCDKADVTETQIKCFPPASKPEAGLGGDVDGAPAVSVSEKCFLAK